MDFSQNKLSKHEWESLEKPVLESEKTILKLIIDGFANPSICKNDNSSLFQFLKTEKSEEIEYHLYKQYFFDIIKKYIEKYTEKNNKELRELLTETLHQGKELKSIRSGDTIRLQNLQTTIDSNREKIFEFFLIELGCSVLKMIHKNNKKYIFYYYTLKHLLQNKIDNINKYVLKFCDSVLSHLQNTIHIEEIVYHAYELIENNTHLLNYEDKQLFTHQKQLFQLFQQNENKEPRLVLYTAPTGTGKTLTPLGLSQKYRVIFVCVARHIGLALAKSAISTNKKIAFGFGCQTASDIRLHYFAAKDFKKDYRSGGIFKVNNSIGDNVEIMICDVQSYLTCMHYMLSFNRSDNIITFWDEPTITLDYESHELHSVINKNWKENLIPNMILSCATLPEKEELISVEQDFKNKFIDHPSQAQMYCISSYDCKKSISVLDKDGYNALPHYLFTEYNDLVDCVNYIDKNKTLLRYFDLQEVVDFIEFVNENEYYTDASYEVDEYFEDNILKVTMNNLKIYYLRLLKNVGETNYQKLHTYFMTQRKKKFDSENIQLRRTKSLDNPSPAGGKLRRLSTYSGEVTTNKNHKSTGISLTTSDAYTLTDGPTIFLADDVEKIGNFYIQNTNIPVEIFKKMLVKITKNNDLVSEIDKLEKLPCFQDKNNQNDDDGGKKKDTKEFKLSNEAQEMQRKIDKLRKQIMSVSMDAKFIPNSVTHQHLWTPTGEVYENAYISSIGEEMTKKIMALPVENYCKVLLLLGIGLFSTHNNKDYVEVIKQLAEDQRLFIIIASSDYIYGTNYQFCHGFLGKDLQNLTQQKIVQAMGRIGRNNIQQQYTIRFRENAMIRKVFTKQSINVEATNLQKLFSSD
jgi:hypothetical protein|uniref:Helicase/UvrB N-terminal domain-containing protein n=1 Tax=viral metagenome TaxID=1070528 RepID=A0A6C0INY0_9ZZZZ